MLILIIILEGKLPHSCDSTAQLAEIVNRDNDSNSNSHSNTNYCRSENELRVAYSLVIVRSINGLVDHNQQGIFADSVLGLASRIGIITIIIIVIINMIIIIISYYQAYLVG